jgi:hypothetical protein
MAVFADGSQCSRQTIFEGALAQTKTFLALSLALRNRQKSDGARPREQIRRWKVLMDLVARK